MFVKVIVKTIALYQDYGRGIFPSACRFTPTCSEYAKEAFGRHGFIKGGYKALTRLLRCHPFSRRSGYDPLTPQG